MNYEFKGTPGPWTIEGWVKVYEQGDAPSEIFAGLNGHRVGVASINFDISKGLGSEMATANSQLIKTAPELLECLIESVKHIKETDFDVCGTPESLMQKWENVIKKALNQQP